MAVCTHRPAEHEAQNKQPTTRVSVKKTLKILFNDFNLTFLPPALKTASVSEGLRSRRALTGTEVEGDQLITWKQTWKKRICQKQK